MSYTVQMKQKMESNRVSFLDSSIHNWYRFVLSFPPHLVNHYLKKFNASGNTLVLDPFCGTGTTLVECKKNYIPSIGLEANPIALFASNVKINWSIEPSKIIKLAKTISDIADTKIQNHEGDYLELTDEQEKLIIKNSISPLPLHKSLILLNVINLFRNNENYNHLRLAFAKQLVNSYSNLHFGPEVGVSRNKKDNVDVVSLWLREVVTIAHDIALYKEKGNTYGEAFFADSRNVKLNNKVDIIFTSPPYPNEKDYSQTKQARMFS
jgi:SAM-dependent methyltransferase